MQPLNYMENHGHERLIFWHDKDAGLKAIIAIHDTTLGPALGGIRMWPYASEAAAVADALRLSEAMTYKASMAGLNLGGGKGVILGDPATDKDEKSFRSFGRFVDSLDGAYITSEDVGTDVNDLSLVHQETRHVTGLAAAQGGSGDPSPVTAYGVYRGMRAACQAVFGSASLSGRIVAVQGLGKVGYALAEYLVLDGATVVAVELNSQTAARARQDLGIELVEPDQIYDTECDIFAPCALGAVINDQTLPRLRCSIVAGSANNQLARMNHGDELHRRNVLYVPDFVVNAGGLISVASELGSYGSNEVKAKVSAIYDTVEQVIALAQKANISTNRAAYRLAKSRVEQKRHHRSLSGLSVVKLPANLAA